MAGGMDAENLVASRGNLRYYAAVKNKKYVGIVCPASRCRFWNSVSARSGFVDSLRNNKKQTFGDVRVLESPIDVGVSRELYFLAARITICKSGRLRRARQPPGRS